MMKTAALTLVFFCQALVGGVAGAAPGKHPAMLTNVKEMVDCKVAGQETWKRAGLMALLAPGDLLRTGSGSAATVVFFADGHMEKVPAGVTVRVQQAQLQPLGGGLKRLSVPASGRTPAGAANAILVLKGGGTFKAVGPSAAGRYGAVGMRHTGDPQLLSPLPQKTRSDRPEFAWTPVEGADLYEVCAEDQHGKVLLKRQTTGTRLPYPPELPALARNAGCRWSVEARAGAHVLARNNGEFHVLAARSVAALARQEVAVRQQLVPGDTTAPILLARLHMDFGLCGEAIEQLERAVAINPEDPGLHEELAHLHSYVGNTLAAQKATERAAALRRN
ncbi:MAG: hypothetical protein HY321_22235 [Armatimonadetes bacterium]|nr:hypothetical protein [Armatimonadota bacterium]